LFCKKIKLFLNLKNLKKICDFKIILISKKNIFIK
jgi:DNA-binding Xre family transcriptional regulator